jgi:hypothetical protein
MSETGFVTMSEASAPHGGAENHDTAGHGMGKALLAEVRRVVTAHPQRMAEAGAWLDEHYGWPGHERQRVRQKLRKHRLRRERPELDVRPQTAAGLRRMAAGPWRVGPPRDEQGRRKAPTKLERLTKAVLELLEGGPLHQQTRAEADAVAARIAYVGWLTGDPDATDPASERSQFERWAWDEGKSAEDEACSRWWGAPALSVQSSGRTEAWHARVREAADWFGTQDPAAALSKDQATRGVATEKHGQVQRSRSTIEGRWTTPMSKSEIARRILGRPDARWRKVENMFPPGHIQSVDKQVVVRYDHLPKSYWGRLENPARV